MEATTHAVTAPATATAAAERISLLIGGERYWSDENVQTVRSPWDGSLVAEVPQLSDRRLREAVDWAAGRARACAAWPVADRIDTMLAWADLLARNAEQIARLETREMGKPIQQTRRIVAAVVARLKNLCQARRLLRGGDINHDASPLSKRAHVICTREPLGLVAGILPFNSPVSAFAWKVAPALLMGNAVIVKVSELAPAAALAAAGLLATLPLPVGALQVVNGLGTELGPVLSEHPAIRMIGFTGGSAAGCDIMRRSASSLKRLVLECGSNDATIILDDADLAAAAKMVAATGMRLYNGEICVAPKRCLVDRSVYDRFAELLAAEAQRLKVGDPLDETTDLGPLVSATNAARVERQVNEGVAAGARLVCGGRRLAEALMPPTVLADVTPSNPLFREGAFGPVVSLIRTDGAEQAAALANDSPYALRASIYTRNYARGAHVARLLEFNGVAINSPPTVDSPQLAVVPRKLSGVGTEGVEASLLEYSQPKFIWMADWWDGGDAAAGPR